MNKCFWAIIGCLLLLSASTYAQQPIVFQGQYMIIGKSVAILEDPNNTYTINSVSQSSGFIPSLLQTPNLKLSTSSFWLKFSIYNKSSEKDLLLALGYPTLSLCEFYYPENGKYAVKKLSDNVPFHQRKYQHQNFIFDVHLPTDSTQTYYLHVKSGEETVLPLILATPQEMAESLLGANVLWGIFAGLILVMVLYNFFIFLFTKDTSYLYYVLYSMFIGLTQLTLSGYTYHYLFTNSPALFHNCIIIFPALAGISAMMFVRSFLQTKTSTPILHKVFWVAIALYTIAIILRLSGFDLASYRMIDISALITTAIIYIVAVKISMQGYRPAKLFLVAWTIFFAGIILFTLRNLGVLPYNNFTNYTMESGIAFEVTLLSLALADKINILKKEKETSQAEALASAKENERIIREQNVILEIKVEERTAELNVTLADLKDAQAQLVDSEKMASLGQLTAGIAHEINNPINFVTSNVSPLKRDVDMVFDTLTFVEQVGLSNVSVAEKEQQIMDYKEDLDFEYLKTEIKHLLKGIHEGASRTAEIVKGLRVFSRLDEDDLKLADINEGLESSMIILNNILDKTEVIREYGNLPLLECYPGKLNQVFLNILSNGVYAVNKAFGDEPGGKIIIKTTSDDKNVFIMIKDNGIGMDEPTKKKIFEPFFTTKGVGEGTGLGMSIAYAIIKKHNGEINVITAPGQGAVFTIQLPVKYMMKIV